MSTQKNELYHILSPEWLKTNPLPEDGEFENNDGKWLVSSRRGHVTPGWNEYPYRTRRTDLPPEAYITPPTDTTGSDLLSLLQQIEMHCPCGARPESLDTHPHVVGCPVEQALVIVRSGPPEGWQKYAENLAFKLGQSHRTTGSGREGETPETDKQEFNESCNFDVDWPNFARQLERQRDAALAKNADLLKSENDQLADIEALTSHITTDVDAPETSGSVVEKVEWLLAQVEALRRDGERLDWLETHPFMAYRDRDPADGKIDGHFTLVDEDRGRKHGRRGIVEPTLRAAIDSAQRQEGRK